MAPYLCLESCRLCFTTYKSNLHPRFKPTDYADDILAWLHYFLTDRFQCVKVLDEVAKELPVVSGVVQGSVLGSTLFLFRWQ
jgi:hypothetical protein